MHKNMATSITVLHITDIHIKATNVSDVKRRVTSFIKYANQAKINPDIVIVSGDLTYNGTSDEFELFREVFLAPITAGLRIPTSRIILIPGNHDVHRDSITAPEVNKRDKRLIARDAEAILQEGRGKRLAHYYSFLDSLKIGQEPIVNKTVANGNAFVRVIKIKGIRVGLACLNTAWQCADDNDKGHLVLTEAQVAEAIQELGQIDLKIGVCHHPGDWLLPEERELGLQDLKREFDVILSGHLHDPESHYHLDPSAEHLWFVGRAFFDGKVAARVEDGFHFYELDPANKTLTAFYRKFVRKRDTFAADTDHADDGQFEFKLPLKHIFSSETLVVQRLAEQGNSLHLEIRKELSILQDTLNPVIITPRICGLTFEGGERKRSRTATSIPQILEASAVLYGPQDSGKSILLKAIASENHVESANQIMQCGDDSCASLYLKLSAGANIDSPEDLLKLVTKAIDDPLLLEPGKVKIRLLVDDVKKDVVTVAAAVNTLCRDRGWTYIIAIGSDLALDAIAQSREFEDVKFFEVLPWGPSKIREMAQKLFENTGVDIDTAFKNVKRSLAAYDLPANPTTVSLYMSLMAKGGAAISGVSFLRLLELIEEKRIGAAESPPVDTKYYRQQVLCRLAAHMLATSSDVVAYEEALRIAIGYLTPPMFEKNAEPLLQSLIRSGLLVSDHEQVYFVNFVFLDYFIAKAISEGLINEESVSRDLAQCVRLAQALALFAGMKRENSPLAVRILSWIEQRFPEPETRTLKDLDLHVKTLLSPEFKDDDIDGLVDKDLARKVDHSKEDERFDERRVHNTKSRKRMITTGHAINLDELSAHTASLSTFYGILKNLEAIDGDRKVAFLNRILDFHIRTNFYLIDYFHSLVEDDQFKTIAAYILTWSGHKFMAASLGSQALCSAIKACIAVVKNDLKELLLILMLSDLRDSESLKYIREFAEENDSVAAIEILFIHLRHRMIEHDSALIPTDLISVFRAVFERRQSLYSKRQNRNEIGKQFDKVLRETKVQHSVIRQSGITS